MFTHFNEYINQPVIRFVKAGYMATLRTEENLTVKYKGIELITLDFDAKNRSRVENIYFVMAASICSRISFRKVSSLPSSCEGHWLHFWAQS